jgi:hypothetical protein
MRNQADAKKRPQSRPSREVKHEHKNYISVRVAARRAGLSHTTMYLWAQRGRTPNGMPLDVIKDTLTNQILISEESIRALLQNRFRPLEHPTGTEGSSE